MGNGSRSKSDQTVLCKGLGTKELFDGVGPLDAVTVGQDGVEQANGMVASDRDLSVCSMYV